MVEPLLVAATILAGGFVLAQIFGILTAWYARKIAPKTKTKLDDKLVAAVASPVKYAILLSSVLIAAYYLFPEYSETILLAEKVLLILLLGKAAKDVVVILFEEYINILPIEPQHRDVLLGAKGILNTVLYIIILLVLLSAVGVDIWPILTGLGVGGLALSMAMKDVLSDYVAGTILILSGEFRKGQEITIYDKKITGRILEIGWRHTKIETAEGDIVNVPNRVVASAVIVKHKKE